MKGPVMENPNAAELNGMTDEEAAANKKRVVKTIVKNVVIAVAIPVVAVVGVRMLEKALNKKDSQNAPE